jgi:potassium-transporting ATPase KdpC subunit
MRREITASIIAAVVFTVIFGLAYPLIATGVSQVLFPNRSDGSQVTLNGRVVGSKLIGQSFDLRRPNDNSKKPRYAKKQIKTPNPRYFQPRPSVTTYSPDVTYFNNLGPNNKALMQQFKGYIGAYLALERPYVPSLTRRDIPVDAITSSASGVDPHISQANARIQAHRISAVRHIPLNRVNQLIDENTDGRALGVLGEPGVNVLELNIALEEESQ